MTGPRPRLKKHWASWHPALRITAHTRSTKRQEGCWSTLLPALMPTLRPFLTRSERSLCLPQMNSGSITPEPQTARRFTPYGSGQRRLSPLLIQNAIKSELLRLGRHYRIGSRIKPAYEPCPSALRGVRTTVTVHGASPATLPDTLPRKERASEFCRAPITM